METGGSGIPSQDPLDGDPRVRALFGERLPVLEDYARLLRTEGVERGLIGPREADRLWERHLLNCASIAPLLSPGLVADIGSGAGLPGLVLAAMDPDRDFVLIDSMARRAEWLSETSRALGLDRVRVIRARAEDLPGSLAPTIVARAVARIDRLVLWGDRLMSEGGEMLFLKGRSAADEVESAQGVLRRRSLYAEVVSVPTVPGVPGSTVVRVRREIGRSDAQGLES